MSARTSAPPPPGAESEPPPPSEIPPSISPAAQLLEDDTPQPRIPPPAASSGGSLGRRGRASSRPESRSERVLSITARGDKHAPLTFKQGANAPYGIRWYGLTSLYGHWRNFISRAIAAESVDTRDWMKPNEPQQLLAAMARTLGGNPNAVTLTEALGRPVYIDFVADSGDDRDVSAAVGAMIARTYEVGGRVLPRGDMLVFGGDVAYPVATAEEIHRRLVLPWNESLRKIHASDERRVLLGVPGNHDWYDGLDGFGRLFRCRVDEPFRADDRDPQPKLMQRLARSRKRPLGLVARGLHFDEIGSFFGIGLRIWRVLRAFFRGVALKRRRRLSLKGYEPVQEASYFAMALAPGLEMWGCDRQLGRVDFRQRAFFKSRRADHLDDRIMFISADPAIAYGLRNDPGARMLAACTLDFEHDKVLYLTGDFHHYERRKMGPHSTHVIAGGGGAFLHGTRISAYPAPHGPPDCVYPTGEMSRQLALQVPWKLVAGRSGFVPHDVAALLAVAQIVLSPRSYTASVVASAVGSALVTLTLFLVAGYQNGERSRRVLGFSAAFGLVIGMLPMLLRALMTDRIPVLAGDTAIVLLCAFVGAFLYGVFLMTMAMLGFEHQQAFTVLGHPGFKHFVRLCVHPDGRVEAFTIGKDDMLAKGKPSIIDSFSW